MKTPKSFAVSLALAILAIPGSQLSTCLAQGSLTPPGAPGPTMKSLAQIEPRTPISSAPFTITQPGSYYLTTNLSVSNITSASALTIDANQVTLDLNGFTLFSTVPTSANGYGILFFSGLSDITILNGHICGGVTNNGSGVYGGNGFSFGIGATANPPVNARVSGVTVSGCLNYGIAIGSSGGAVSGGATVVESCTVRTVGGYGITASTVKNSVALDCANTAINGSQVSDCNGQCTGSGDGIDATIAQNCSGSSGGSGSGVSATTAQNCYGFSSSGNGIHALNALNCYGLSTTGTGVYANVTAQNCEGISQGGGYGINTGCAQNCDGHSNSGYGIWAYAATACNGYSTSGTGLYATTASLCVAFGPASGTALRATVASGCYSAQGTNNITYKYNMP